MCHKNRLVSRLQDYLASLEHNICKVLEESLLFALYKQSMMATYRMTSEAIISRSRKAAYIITLIGAFDGTGWSSLH